MKKLSRHDGRRKAVVVGATSGIGREVALCLLRDGWFVGIAGRRIELLEELKAQFPDSAVTHPVDVMSDDAADGLMSLTEKLGGMDLFFLASGTGRQNPGLNEEIEISTAETNVTGFIRMVTAAFRYFEGEGGGHIAVISSIAGTKGLGPAPAYSATKRFQNTYIEALAQLSFKKKSGIAFTDIRPGFVDTAILNTEAHAYPMLMRPEKVAKAIVKALYGKKRIKIIDGRYRILVFLWRLIPRYLWERMKI
ncbi:MAG: SDR family NAD(P)-dependent oxidoreductase [Tannerella sp.]|jgi:short-subunit dehydrogenase|nr:SDR family NAD(P)-dependent oxidoreductase [Tannerella sp.]